MRKTAVVLAMLVPAMAAVPSPAIGAIVAQDTGSICGAVKDHNGTNISGARVAVASVVAGSRSTVTGTDGSFCVNGLPAGSYSVFISARGSRSRRFTVTVDQGARARIDATLPMGSIQDHM